MSDKPSVLLTALQVEQLDTYLFRGLTPKPSMPRIYGGQVMAQAMNAATRTAQETRRLHSFHAYFLRPGNPNQPIIFDVDPIRDGGSFTTRRVVAKQDGKAIYNCALSYMEYTEGYSHQQPMPEVPSPDGMQTDEEYMRSLAENHQGAIDGRSNFPEWDVRWFHDMDPVIRKPRPPVLELWLRFKTPVPEKPLVHQTLLAYASDLGLMGAAILPHAISPLDRDLQMASLDHGMWFHNACNVNDWIYYRAESHWSGNGRGLNMGRLYQGDSTLLATTMQEGLMRISQK